MTKWLILSLQYAMALFQKLLALLTRGEWPPFCSVLAIVEQDGRLLAIDRTDGQGIFLPGGFLKLMESPEQAIVREMQEETGFDVLPQRLLGAYAPKKQRIRSVILCYRCQLVGGSEQSSPEGGLLWIERSQAGAILHPLCRPCLADYETSLRKRNEPVR